MTTATPQALLTPEEVERAGERDGKLYELLVGDLRPKGVGARALFVAGQIAAHLNAQLYPQEGVAVCEAMVYCFGSARQGRRPDVAYVKLDRLPDRIIPEGDIMIVPDLVVEVLSTEIPAIDVYSKLDEFLDAGVRQVWTVNMGRRTLRVYRQDGTTRLYQATEAIESEPALPGFRLVVGDVFPPA